MISPERFIETSDNREAWLEARRPAVTATEVAKAATPAGFLDAVSERRNPTEVVANEYMQFGNDNEDWIARWLKAEFGLMPNRWLIAAEDNALHMATPDGLSLDHTVTGEIKTGGTEPKSPPRIHRDQMQWQMACTGAELTKYAFMLRQQVNGMFVPAWLEPKVWDVPRDDARIAVLVEVAAQLLLTDTERLAA